MDVPLSSIATVQSGIVLGRKEARDSIDAIKYSRLTLRSLNSVGCIDRSEVDDFYSRDVISESHRTQPGDIVIRLFAPLLPTLITASDVGLVVPSQLAIIRIFDSSVLPAYLQYCLTRQDVTESFLAIDSFTQRAITVKSIANISISVIPQEAQLRVKQIYETSIRRAQLYQQLIEQEEQQASYIIDAVIRGAHK